MRHILRTAHAVVLAAVSLTLVYAAIAICRHSAINFDYFSADGAFQLFNPMRRLAAGQVLGRDFFFFHGFLLPHLHYALFRWIGTDLFASEVARWSVTQVLFLSSSIYFLRRLKTPWLYATSVVGILYGVPKLFDLGVMIEPANSLLATRAAPPLFILAWWIGRVIDDRWSACARRYRTWAFAGGLAALTMAIGSEQGLAMVLIGGGVAAFFPDPRGARMRLAAVVIFALSFFVALLSLSYAVAGEYALANLRFNLIEVPQDQMWYFGSPPVPYLGAWSDFLAEPLIVQRLLAAALLALGLLVTARLARRADVRRIAAAMIVPPVYGLLCSISLLGIYAIHYTLPIHRALLLICAAALFHAANRWRSGALLPFAFAAIAIWLNSNPAIPDAMILHSRINALIMNSELTPGARELLTTEHSGVRLSPIWANSLAQVRLYLNPPGPLARGDLWSTYAGMYELEYGVFQPDTDYIIHALGDIKRDGYVAHFETARPLYAATKRRTYFGFEWWLQQSNWSFYRALITAYDPIFTTTMDVFWRRAGDARAAFVPLIDQHFAVPTHEPRDLYLPSGVRDKRGPVLFEVTVDYKVTNHFGVIPVLGKTPRFFAVIRIGGAVVAKVSLPPHRRAFSFPLFAEDTLSLSIEPAVESLMLPADLAFTGLRASRVSTSPATIEALLY